MSVSYSPRPPGVAAPAGQYSHLGVAPASGLVSVAGQVGIDQNGDVVGFDDVEAQTIQALRNVEAVLAAARATWGDVLSLTSYVVGREHLPGFAAARGSVYASAFADGPYPPNTLLVVDGLARPELLVEIQALAVRHAG